MNINLPSPIQHLIDFSSNYNVFIKREDLIHPEYGGNKWRKLKYNIEDFLSGPYKTLITFGGPFSNHIAATAAVCRDHQINCIGIIRGEYIDSENPTLSKAREDGMKLIHISKSDYKLKAKSSAVIDLIDSTEMPFILPEGGSNISSLLGMNDLLEEVNALEVKFDYICVAAGTGATSAGLIRYNRTNAEIIVVNALKNKSLSEAIDFYQEENSGKRYSILENYHCGGFAKVSENQTQFASWFYNLYEIKLDPIYNSKLFYAIKTELDKKLLKEGSNILCINTGGVQGTRAYEYTLGRDWISKSI